LKYVKYGTKTKSDRGVAMALAGAELFHLTGSSSSSSEEEGEEATARTDNFMAVVHP